MTDEQYMTFLYDRAARRAGFASYAEQRAHDDTLNSERATKEQADRQADLEAWAKAQLSTP